MPARKKPEFPLTPNLEKFKYEVADEISLLNRKYGKTLTANPPAPDQNG
ncbi:MAG: hypothetical protein M0Z55_02930 [Peptococcaceae bacterium]|nr:hypothetical protein [Peptococcaceae bacterium]